MIPILFEPKTTNFNTNGIGRLSDAVSCIVTEVRNGEYELEMQYPVDGVLYRDISASCLIYAEPGSGRSPQPFAVYKTSKPINKIVTIYAHHISYRMSLISCSPFTAENVVSALDGLKEKAAVECPFMFWTDKTSSGKFSVDVPSSMRSRLGGVTGSILDVYGGEYEFDMYTVRLHENRGTDHGVVLKYGKNITDLKQEENIQNTITGIHPYWADSEENVVELPEKVLLCDKAENFPFPRIATIDFSQNFQEKPSIDELREAGQAYISSNNIGIPSVSISVSFEYIWQSEEYKDIAPVEKVNLCDIVTVEYEKLGVEAKAKVVKTIYDVLKEKYTKIEVGEAKSTLSDTIAAQAKMIQDVPTKGFMEAAVQNATNWITGVNGGYVVFHKDAQGIPYEILIMDNEEIEKAVGVWRFNKNGWGYSKSGYNGPYEMAATMDGGIVADFITAGTMLANRIKGGTLTLGGVNNGDGVCVVLDQSGKEVARLDVNGLHTSSADITGGKLNIVTASRMDNRIVLEYVSGSGDTYSVCISPNGIVVSGDGSNTTRLSLSTAEIRGSSSGFSAGGFSIDPVTAEFYNLVVNGSKNRAVKTENYGRVLMSAYETAEPYFADIGYGEIKEDGQCIVEIDSVFAETVMLDQYAVFLQAEGEGNIYLSEKKKERFVVKGTPGMMFSYEIKAHQVGYENVRLEVMK